MKGDGREHGTVRTDMTVPGVPRSPSKGYQHAHKSGGYIKSKVRSKSMNHSKLASKCGDVRCTECHMGSLQKYMDKTKGSKGSELSYAVSNHRLITWQVVHGRTGSNFSGLSAAGLLDFLAQESLDDYGENYMRECDEL